MFPRIFRNKEKRERGENKEDQEKSLKDYLEREVYPRFGISEEDERQLLEEMPENQRERARRSFENMRFIIFELFELETIVGRVNQKEYERAREQWVEECARAEKAHLPIPLPPKPEDFRVVLGKNEVLEEIEEELRRIEETGFLSVNCSLERLFTFLAQELPILRGAAVKRETLFEEYGIIREEIESALGFEKPPIYGAFCSSNGFEEVHGIPIYGALFLKLKPTVITKTMYCIGDSICGRLPSIEDGILARIANKFRKKDAQTTARTEYDYREWVKRRQICSFHAPLAKAILEFEKKRLINLWGGDQNTLAGMGIYLEAHIPDEIKIEDIESVNIPRSAIKEIKNEDLKRLKEILGHLNIPFVIFEEKQSDG